MRVHCVHACICELLFVQATHASMRVHVFTCDTCDTSDASDTRECMCVHSTQATQATHASACLYMRHMRHKRHMRVHVCTCDTCTFTCVANALTTHSCPLVTSVPPSSPSRYESCAFLPRSPDLVVMDPCVVVEAPVDYLVAGEGGCRG